MTGLLAGVRVIESSMLLNGASTGMMLAQLGAEVIKIESPFLGDYLRLDETAHLNQQANAGKRSLALDLRKPEGREAFYRLLETADVFVTNATAGKNEKLGIGYAELSARKPSLVYVQNTGFGATGPYAALPAHGQMMDALAGAMPVIMAEDGLTEPDPAYVRRVGSLVSAGEGTAAGAIYAAFNVAAALARAARTGKGAFIDVSSSEAVVASAWVAASGILNTPPEKHGWWRNDANQRTLARYQFYQAGDGLFLLFCPEEQKFWHKFCDLVERPDLRDLHSGEALRHSLQEIFQTRPRKQWVDLAIANGIPIGPVTNDIAELLADPQYQARDFFTRTQDFVTIGQPAIIDGHRPIATGRAPELGEHTDAVLAELGYDEAERAALAAADVTSGEALARAHLSADVYSGKS